MMIIMQQFIREKKRKEIRKINVPGEGRFSLLSKRGIGLR